MSAIGRVVAYGDRALLVEPADVEEVLGLAVAVREAAWPEVVDVVPAARTVLVVGRRGADLGPLERRLADVRIGGSVARADANEVTIEVTYDGEDLAAVAGLAEMSEREVVAAHCGSAWRVAFMGFAPGFAYLVGGDPRLAVPRRDQARVSVPTGSVGLAGEYSGIYPRSSPGGWQLIGRTGSALWDLHRDPPALLRPGTVVRFVERS